MSKNLVSTPSAALPLEYAEILAALKERVRSAQYAALKAVNTELVGLYWDIGCMLVERQTDAGWGKGVVQQLAVDLQQAFPGVGGFSASNLWRMKAFFEAYRDQEKLAPLVREIGWSHKGAPFGAIPEPKGDLQLLNPLTGFDGKHPHLAHIAKGGCALHHPPVVHQ